MTKSEALLARKTAGPAFGAPARPFGASGYFFSRTISTGALSRWLPHVMLSVPWPGAFPLSIREVSLSDFVPSHFSWVIGASCVRGALSRKKGRMCFSRAALGSMNTSVHLSSSLRAVRVGRPLTTRRLVDAIARSFAHRAGGKIQTVSTLVAELMAQGWVAGEKRGGTRWVYRPTVSRDQGLTQIARWVVQEFVREPEDRLCLIREALRMVGFVPMASLEALADHVGRRAKSAAAELLSGASFD